MSDLQMKHCVTKTENKKDIKRQKGKNLIFEQTVVVVKKKCDKNLSNCLSEEKEENEKNKSKKNNEKKV